MIDQAITYASQATGISADAIMGHSRHKPVSQARHMAMTEAHRLGMNYYEIGRAMNVDRTSVRYAVRKNLAAYDK